MDPAEAERRPSVKIHLALLASLGLYGLLLAQVRLRMRVNHSTPEPRMSLFVPMLIVGTVEFAVITLVAQKRLRSAAGPPAARARMSFLLRAAAAEVLALFGLMIGVQGAPVLEAAALFALGLAAMLGSFPTREAWQNAMRTAQTGAS